ncbi:MAG: C25 family peptidase propeptide domain-containing protein, partial [Thermoplasmatota archaeon]
MRYKAFIGVFTLCILVAGTGFTAVPTPGTSHDAAPAQPAATSETLSFTFSSPEIAYADGYCTVSVAEAASSLHNGGAPRLPQHTETLHLPAGATVTDVSLRHSEVYTRQLPSHVLPALEPAAVGRQMAPQRVEGAVYGVSDAYPSGWAEWHNGVGLHDGERVTFCSLQVFPARYIPASRELRYVEDVTVEVSYRASEKPV